MLFFFFMVLIFCLSFTYIGLRLIKPLQVNRFQKTGLWLFLFLLFTLPFVSMILNRTLFNKSVVHLLNWIGFTGLGFIALVFVLMIIRDLGLGLAAGFQKLVVLGEKFKKEHQSPPDPDRRALMTQAVNLGLLGLSASGVGYGLFQARRKPQLIELDIPLKRLPRAFHGLRIAQFSDLHVGPTIKGDFVKTVVDEINNLHPDMITFTGDLVDGSVEILRDDVACPEGLKAPLGKFFITGNHEYYSGVYAWIEKVKQLGFDVLLNENRQIIRGDCALFIAGVTDYRAGGFTEQHPFNPEKAVAGIPQDRVKIMLAHQPKGVERIADAGFDLQISGHTHGGQFFPGNLLARLDQPYISGLYKHQEMWVYVNSGTGYWGPPLRIGTRSEITLLRLLKA